MRFIIVFYYMDGEKFEIKVSPKTILDWIRARKRMDPSAEKILEWVEEMGLELSAEKILEWVEETGPEEFLKLSAEKILEWVEETGLELSAEKILEWIEETDPEEFLKYMLEDEYFDESVED